MKKSIITLLAVICSVSAFAADFLGWGCKDVEALKKAVASAETKINDKINYSVNIAYLENPEIFKTYADLKNFVAAKANEFNYSNYNLKVSAATQVLCRSVWFKKFLHEAFQDCADTSYGIYFIIYDRSGLSAADSWRYIGNFLIDGKSIGAGYLTPAIDKMINMDLRIPKAEKIEVYSLLYEKYLPKLTDEQNLANDKKIYTPILGKIALKLKALGVKVEK